MILAFLQVVVLAKRYLVVPKSHWALDGDEIDWRNEGLETHAN